MERLRWAVWVGPVLGLVWLLAAAPAARATPGASETWLRRVPSAGAEWSALHLEGAGGAAARQPAPVPQKSVPLLRRQRPNTISLGFQAGYGIDRGNSRIADGFDHGPGYAVRFRYMMSPSAALGFSFEYQRYGSIQPPLNVQGDFADSHVVITTVAVEPMVFLHREREFTPYFLGGLGYATPDVIFTADQASRVNEGLFAVVGAGFERFIRERFSFDMALREYALVSNSEFTSMTQLSVGIHVYPGD